MPNSVIKWPAIAARILRERVALAGLLQAFIFGLIANGTIHAGNFRLTQLGAGSSFIGYATALQALGIVCAAPLLVLLTQRARPANLALTAGGLAALGFVGSFLASGWAAIAAARFVLGCGIGLGMAFVEYLVVSQVRRDVRPVFAMLFGLLLAAGHALGTLLTGQTSQPFVLAVLAAAILGGTFATAPWGRLRHHRQVLSFKELPRIVAISPAVFAAAALFGFLDNGFLSMLPDILQTAGQAKTQTILTSFIAFAGICAFQIPAGLLCLRVAPYPLLRFTVLMLIVAVMMLAMVTSTVALRGPTVFVLGGLVDLVYTVGLITLSNAVPRSQMVMSNACFVSFCGLGEVAGPAVTGPALGALGAGGAIGVVLFLLAAFWFFSAYREIPPAKDLRHVGHTA